VTVIKRARPREAPAVPISGARRRLFELVEDVLTGRADSVALSHRGYDERVLLFRARDLTKLEADLAALRGRGRLHGGADEVLGGVRRPQAALAAAKRDALQSRGRDGRDGEAGGRTRSGA
jgi:hypothetical protein